MQGTSIVLVGVGGQGILFATKALAGMATHLGYEVIGTETHGMSQRGGSVASHLKIGGRSPLVRRGTADLLLALDASEAAKSLDYLRTGGLCIANAPDGTFPTPALQDFIRQRDLNCAVIDADAIAREVGVPSVANAVLLGFAASLPEVSFSLEQLTEGISRISKERFRDINLEALRLAAQAAQSRVAEGSE